MPRLTIAKAYERVNETWPAEVPPLTAPEATRAAKRLYRFAMGATWAGGTAVTSGNRYSGIAWRPDGGAEPRKRVVLLVNPGRGWKALVHHLSHDFYYRANPGEKPHSKDHARLERQMIAEVVKRGWLDGKLRDEPKAKPSKNEKREQRLVRLDSRIEEWERKAKRAASALKRLHAERKTLVRAIEKESSDEHETD